MRTTLPDRCGTGFHPPPSGGGRPGRRSSGASRNSGREMSPRHRISAFGRRTAPALALGAVAGGLACACLPWSLEQPRLLAFVDAALREQYGLTLSAGGRSEVSLLPLPRLSFHDIRLAAGAAGGPLLAEGGTLSLQLGLAALLSGRVELESLALEGARLALPASAADTRWSGPLARLSARLASAEIGHPRRLTLSGVGVTGRDPRDGSAQAAREVDLVVTWPPWSASLDLAGSFSWNGARVHVALTGLRPADLAQGAASPFAFDAAWPAGSLAFEGAGSLRDGPTLSGGLRVDTRSLAETLAWSGGGMALSPLIEDVALEGRLEASAEGLRLSDLSVRAGANRFEGAASAEFAGRRPSIRATLAADTLNLGPLLAGTLRLAGFDGAGAWGRHPLALAPLLAGDLDLRLSGAGARLGPVLLEEVAASVIVREDRIDAALGRAGLQGGALKGRLQLAALPGSDETEVKAQGAFEGIDPGALLTALGEAGWMLGAVQGAFALEGRGRDAEALVRRLSGRASLSGGAGTLVGLDLPAIVHRGGRDAQGPLSRRNARTPFEQVALSVTFAEGIGEIGEGALAGRDLSASLRGRISLPERQFRARAELLPRASGAGAPAGLLYEIDGPWDGMRVEGRILKASDAEPFAEPFRVGAARDSAAIPPSPPPLLRTLAP